MKSLRKIINTLLVMLLCLTSLTVNIMAEEDPFDKSIINTTDTNISKIYGEQSHKYYWLYYVSPREFFTAESLERTVTFNVIPQDNTIKINSENVNGDTKEFVINREGTEILVEKYNNNELVESQTHVLVVDFTEEALLNDSLLASINNNNFWYGDVRYAQDFINYIEIEFYIDNYEQFVSDYDSLDKVGNNIYSLNFDDDVSVKSSRNGNDNRGKYYELVLAKEDREETVRLYFIDMFNQNDPSANYEMPFDFTSFKEGYLQINENRFNFSLNSTEEDGSKIYFINNMGNNNLNIGQDDNAYFALVDNEGNEHKYYNFFGNQQIGNDNYFGISFFEANSNKRYLFIFDHCNNEGPGPQGDPFATITLNGPKKDSNNDDLKDSEGNIVFDISSFNTDFLNDSANENAQIPFIIVGNNGNTFGCGFGVNELKNNNLIFGFDSNQGYIKFDFNKKEFYASEQFLNGNGASAIEFYMMGMPGGNEDGPHNPQFDLRNLNIIENGNNFIYYPNYIYLDDSSKDSLKNTCQGKNAIVFVNNIYNSTKNKLYYSDGYYFTDFYKTEFRIFDLDTKTLNDIQNLDGLPEFHLDSKVTISYTLENVFDYIREGVDFSIVESGVHKNNIYEENPSSNNNGYILSPTNDGKLNVSITTNITGDFYINKILKEAAQEPVGQLPTSIDFNELQNVLENSLYANNGKTITIEEGDYTIDHDVIIRHYGEDGRFDLDAYDSDIMIDLNGSNITFTNGAKLCVEGYSLIHMKDGTITADSDSVIECYGVMSLQNVKLINNSDNQNSYALKQFATRLYTDARTSLEGYNGLLYTSSKYRVNRESGFIETGMSVKARGGNGIDIVNNGTNGAFGLNLRAGNGFEGNNSNKTNLNIEAENIAINANGECNITIAGSGFSSDGNNIELFTNINGKKALVLTSGTLNVLGLVNFKATNGDLIEIVDDGIENRRVDIEFGNLVKAAFVSDKGYIVSDHSNNASLNKVYIHSDNSVFVSYFNYNNDLLNVNSNATQVEITAGTYKTDIASLIKSNSYKTVTSTNKQGYFDVVANSKYENREYEFTWDNTKNEQENINYLQDLMNEVYPQTVRVKNTVNPTQNYVITIKHPRHIYNESIINNITFVVDLGNDSLNALFNGSTQSGDQPYKTANNSLFVVKSGNVSLTSNASSSSTSSPLVLVEGGSFSINGNIVADQEAIVVNAPNKNVRVQLRGNLTSNNKNVLDIQNCGSDSWTVLERDNNNVPVVVNGGIRVGSNSTLTVSYGEIKNSKGPAVNFTGAGTLSLEREAVLDGTTAAIEATKATTIQLHGGTYTGENVFVIHNSNSTQGMLYAHNTPKFKSTGQNGVIVKYDSSSNRDGYYASIEGGFLNKNTSNNEFFNLGAPYHVGTVEEGSYNCVLYDNPSTNDYPYAIVYRYKNLGNVAAVNINDNRTVTVKNRGLLKGLKDEMEENEWAVLVSNNFSVNSSNKPNSLSGYNISEYYDIYVNDITDSSITPITETSNYQAFFIDVSSNELNNYQNIDNIQILHAHEGENTSLMKKISSNDAVNMMNGVIPMEECFFVNGDLEICIITKKFSLFAPMYQNDPVKPSCVHNYGEVTYIWSEDNTTCNASATCAKCSDGINEEVNSTSNVITNATCTNDGSKKFSAEFTNALFSKQEKTVTIDKLGHDLEHKTKVEPTCTAGGFNEYYLCKREGCGAIYSDENGSVSTTLEALKINKLGHSYPDNYTVSTKATYDAKGIEERKCIRCEDVDSREFDYLTINVPTELTATYGDKLSDVVLPTSHVGTWSVVATELNSVVGDAGSKTITIKFTPTNSGKYDVSTFNNIIFKVAKQSTSVETPTASSLTYGQTLSESTLTNGWLWKNDSIIPTVLNDGYIAYTSVDDNNYDYSDILGYNATNHTVERIVSITVAKAGPNVETPTGLISTYGKTLADVTLPDGWKFTSLLTTKVGNANSEGNKFEVVYTPTDISNYNTLTKSIKIVVEKARPNVLFPDLSATYGDKYSDIKLPTGWALDSSVNQNDLVGDAIDVKPLAVIYTPTDTDNYTNLNGNATLKVNKAQIPVYTIPELENVVEGSKLSEIALPDNWTWNNPDATFGKVNLATYHLDNNHFDVLASIKNIVKETITIGDKNTNLSLNVIGSITSKTIQEAIIDDSNVTSTISDILNNSSNVVIDLDKKDLQTITNSIIEGTDVSTTFELNLKDIEIEEDYKDSITDILTTESTLLGFLDITVNLSIGIGVKTYETKVSELSNDLAITIKLPDSAPVISPVQNKNIEYFVVADHNGVKTILPASLNNDGTITFANNKFSTYAIGYKLVDKPAGANPSGSSNSSGSSDSSNTNNFGYKAPNTSAY